MYKIYHMNIYMITYVYILYILRLRDLYISIPTFDAINNAIMNILLQNHHTAEDSLLWYWVGIKSPLLSRFKKYHIIFFNII